LAGSRRALLTLVDQGFSSVSNFAVGVGVAKVAGPAGLGAFAFVYAGWLVLADMHRALITDPMAIEGDVRVHGAHGIQRGFAAEMLLGSVGAIAFAVLGAALMVFHAHTFGTAMLYLAPWLPMLLVQDYWRNVSFMAQMPGRALANDTVFNCIEGAAFVAMFVTHVHSVAAVVTAWGLGGAGGAIFGLVQHRVIPTLRGGLSLLRSRLRMSKWLAATSLTVWGSSQGYIYVVGLILGPAGLGGLKAAQTLVAGPAGVLIQAAGSIGLPEASKAHAERGWSGLVKVSRVVTVAGVMSFTAGAVVVVFWGRALLSGLYGPQFAHLHFAAMLLAIAYIFTGLSVGPVLVLKQTRNAHRVFYSQIINLVVALSTVTLLSLRYGVTGAAIASIATAVVAAVGVRCYQHVVRKAEADRPEEAPAELVEPAVPVAEPEFAAPPPVLSWLKTAQLRRRLSRPTPVLQLVERQLRAHLEATGSSALALVEINAAEPAALAIASLARSLAAEGRRVVIADAAAGRPLATLLGVHMAAGTVSTVAIEGQPVGLFLAPDDLGRMAEEAAGEDADAILVLATADPALGADHIAAWASDAVVMIRARRVSATWIEAVRHQLLKADITIRSAVLVNADPATRSSAISAPYELMGDPTEHPLTTALRAAG
jgi:O-antigen/teichoic acid export membrane protein